MGQFKEGVLVAPLGGEGSGSAIERDADLEQCADRPEGDFGDHDAAAGMRRRQAIRCEPGEGFTEGSSRNSKAGGLLNLCQECPRLQTRFKDVRTQGAVGAIAGFQAFTVVAAHELNVYKAAHEGKEKLTGQPERRLLCIQRPSERTTTAALQSAAVVVRLWLGEA